MTNQATNTHAKKVKNTSKIEAEATPQNLITQQEDDKLFADTNISMNSGHLTRDAEIIGEGKYVKLRFASNKQYRIGDQDEIKTNTNYFDAIISHNLKKAFDLARDFKKGDWIYLKGETSTKSFNTPEGYRKTASTIFAYHVVLKKPKNMSAFQTNEQKQQVSNPIENAPSNS